MSYPFTPYGTLRSLLAELARREGCVVQGINGMASLRGPMQARRVVRTHGGSVWTAQLPNVDDDDAISPKVGRGICHQLGLDPAEYGFPLAG